MSTPPLPAPTVFTSAPAWNGTATGARPRATRQRPSAVVADQPRTPLRAGRGATSLLLASALVAGLLGPSGVRAAEVVSTGVTATGANDLASETTGHLEVSPAVHDDATSAETDPQPDPPSPDMANAAPPTAEPDPALVARNRALSERVARGDRQLIQGRVLAGAGGGLFVFIGIPAVVVGAQFDKKGAIAAGAIAMVAGVAAASAGVVFMIRGKKDVDAANRGELSLVPQPNGAALRLRF